MSKSGDFTEKANDFVVIIVVFLTASLV